MLGLGASRDEVSVVADQRGCPTFVGHLAAATRELVDGGAPFGIWHLAAAGDCTWADLAEAIFDEAGLDCRVRRMTTADSAPRRRGPPSAVLRSEKGAPELPHWREGLAECIALSERTSLVRTGPGRCGSCGYRFPDARARHRRCGVHRLALRPAARRRAATTSSSSTSSPMPGTRRTSKGSSTTSSGGHRRPRRGRSVPRTAATRSSTSRPRPTSTARSSAARSSFTPTSSGRCACSSGRARTARATSRSRPTRCTAISRRAGEPVETDPLRPSSPYSAAKAGGDLQVLAYVAHLRRPGLDHPRRQHLRPEPVPGEARASVRHERARG